MLKKNYHIPVILIFWIFAFSIPPVSGQVNEPEVAEFNRIILTFNLIDKYFLQEVRSAEKDKVAEQEIELAINTYFDKSHIGLSAQVIFSVVDISSKIPNSNRVLNELAERGYRVKPDNTRPDHTALFIHAMSVLELERHDYRAGLIFADSVSSIPQDRVLPQTIAGNFAIRGYCNENLGNLEEAKEDFLKAAAEFNKLPGSESRKISVLHSSARTSLAFRNLGEALRASHNAMKELKKLELSGSRFHEDYQVYRSHALILRKSDRPLEALPIAQKALRLIEKRGEIIAIAHCKQTLAEIYADLDQPEKALANFEAAEVIYRAQDNPVELLIILEDKANFLASLGRVEEAFLLKDQCLDLKDSIALLSQADRILEIRDKHETELVKNKLALAQTQQNLDKTQKTVMGLGLIFFVLLLGLLLSRYVQRNKLQAKLELLVQERTRELEQQARELKQSNEELERFAFITSHDLKAPIRNILGFMSLMKKKNNRSTAEEREEYLDITINSGKQLQRIVDDILSFSRIGNSAEDTASLIQLNGFFDALKKQLSPLLSENNASMEVTGSAEIQIAEGYLTQIFMNLVTNGIKFNESAFPRIIVNAAELPNGIIRVEVSDNGIGISEEFHDQIFDLFKRLHASDQYEGTGLGLATCKKICEGLNGSIEIESTTGEGATFIVTLPRDCSPAKRKKDSQVAFLRRELKTA